MTGGVTELTSHLLGRLAQLGECSEDQAQDAGHDVDSRLPEEAGDPR